MSTTETPRLGLVEWYETRVLPAAFERLDEVFPEFGWKRDARGWVATNRETTKRLFDARPDRVVCHQASGLYIHGQDRSVTWSAYLNGGERPAGADFAPVARALAERAGVAADAIDASAASRRLLRDSRARVAEIRAAYFDLCRLQLADADPSAPQRAYLAARGVDPERALADETLGVAPRRVDASRALLAAGYSRAELDAAGVLADGRWEGRVVGAWRDENGSVATLWARSIDPADEHRYLYLRGATKPTLPYLAAQTFSPDRGAARERIVLVEGVIDAIALHQHAISVAAVGGAATTPATWQALSRVGIERATLLFDRDAAGLDAARRATDTLMRAASSPRVRVADARRLLGAHKDPAALLAAAGADASTAAAELARRIEQTAQAALVWRVAELTGPGRTEMTERRDRVLDRVTTLLAAAPDRFAIERDDALQLASTRLRVDRDVVARLSGLAPGNARSRAATEAMAQRLVELEDALDAARRALLRIAVPLAPEAGDVATHLGRVARYATQTAREAAHVLDAGPLTGDAGVAAPPLAQIDLPGRAIASAR